MRSIDSGREESRLKVAFYALSLKNIAQKNALRSGIALSSYHILLHLAQKCDVSLWSDVEHYEICKRQCESVTSLSTFKFVNGYGWFLRFISKVCYFKFYCHFAYKGTWRDYFGRMVAFPAVLIARHISLCQKVLSKLCQYDVLFSSYHAFPPQVFRLPLLRFMLLHDVIPLLFQKDFMMSEKNIDKALRSLYQVRVRHDFYDIIDTLNKNDYYITNSAFTQAEFLRLCGGKLDSTHMSVALLGVDRSIFYPNKDEKLNLILKEKYHIPSDMNYIFSLCSLEPRKNLIFVIENVMKAFERFAIDDVVLVLAGGAWDSFKGILETRIASLGESRHKIICIGYVEDCDLANLFSHAICSIYLSTYEGFGLPVLESMSCGCPSIASNTTSIPEVLGDGGIALDPKDGLGLQETIYAIYKSPEYATLLSQKALVRSIFFGWEKTTQAIYEAFQKAILECQFMEQTLSKHSMEIPYENNP